jgi:hypothetical protein
MLYTPLGRREFLAGSAIALGAASSFQASPTSPSVQHPEFQLGIVTYNIAAEWDVPKILKVCKESSVKAVELRTTHKHGVEPTISSEKRAEVKKRFADAGIVIWGLGTTCEFHSPDQKVVEKNIETCREFIKLAADLGAKGVKVRPNGLPKDVAVEKTLEQIGHSLKYCGKTAGDLGCEVWVEVHGSGTSKPAHMKTIMDACDMMNVGITWNSNKEDIVNGSVKPSFELLKRWIKSCHINALYGSYPYRELFRCLQSINYNRYTLVEIPEKVDPVNGALLLKYYHRLWKELNS